MALTRRGKLLAWLVTAVIAAGAGAGAFTYLRGGGPAVAAATRDVDGDGDIDQEDAILEPIACPLTGVVPEGGAPDRPALAVKVENLHSARPQAGLNQADVVFEQPVEGNITRFIVVYQCEDADRIGPVRSARLMDPNLLPELGTPLFAYSGAAQPVTRAVTRADLIDLSFEGEAVGAYERDPSREMPHNLYSSTAALYEAAGGLGGPPRAIFTFRDRAPKGTKVKSVRLPFNVSEADVRWTWNQATRTWLRFHGEEAHVDEAGEHVSAANVVVQLVELRDSGIVDAAGNPSPEVEVVGSGKAYVFRNGKMIEGRWRRDSIRGVTEFVGKGGKVIPLAPGNTWVELLPADLAVETA